MAVESRLNQTNYNIILSGETLVKDNETLLQDAGRTTALARGTVMARIAATGKWVPLTNVALLTGEGVARGIYMGEEVTAAALVAGDVTGRLILVGGAATLSSDEVILENSLTAATVVAGGTLAARTIADDLAAVGLFLEDVIDIDEFENA